MKAQRLINAARVKREPELTAESDKPVDNGKGVRARKVMDSYESGARTQGSCTIYLYLANTREVDDGSKLREGVV